MKNFEEEEKQIKEICDRVRNSDRTVIDTQLKIAYYDIMDIMRQAYYEGHDAGVQRLSEIQAKNQEKINNLFKK